MRFTSGNQPILKLLVQCRRLFPFTWIRQIRNRIIRARLARARTGPADYRETLTFTLITASLLILLGWFLHIDFLKRPVCGLITVKVNNALAFILCAISTLAIQKNHNRTAKISAAAVFLLSAAVITEHLIGIDLHIDQLLVPDLNNQVGEPGRMAPLSALTFLICSFGLLFHNRKIKSIYPAEAAGFFAILIGMLSLIGYVYKVPSLYKATEIIGMTGFTGLAFMTACLFILLGIVLLNLHNEHWFRSLWCRDSVGGLVVRSFLPVLVGLPFCFGVIEAYLEQTGVINSEIGISAILISLITLVVIVVMQLADQLDKAERDRIKKTKQRQDLLYALAHDMKVPLIGADRMLELLISGSVQETQTINKYLAMMRESNESLIWKIQNLVYEYRTEQGQEIIQLEQTDLVDLVSGCVDQIKPVAASKSLTLELKSHYHELPMELDVNAIKRVLQNLLHNAIKFTRSGGIEISIPQASDKLLVQIRDTGIGIPEEKQAILFQRVLQSESSRQYTVGSGLGLHLASQIMTAHKGRITCQSDCENGSIFTLEFPFTEAVDAIPEYSKSGIC